VTYQDKKIKGMHIFSISNLFREETCKKKIVRIKTRFWDVIK